MGGRLDAVNALDADCAIVTSIGIDHTDYLGDTREEIGLEKAGIFRRGRPAIVTDPDPPQSLRRHARELGADLQCLGEAFGFVSEPLQWTFWGRRGRRDGLAHPALRGGYQLQNASGCIAALDALAETLPVDMNAVSRGLSQVRWPGRFQVLPGRPAVLLDVAHNPQAAQALASNLDTMDPVPATYAVFGMLRDKDVAAVCRVMRGRISTWYAATLDTPRGAGAGELAQAVHSSDAAARVEEFASPAAAFQAACRHAGENDRIIVFGSFYTVAAVMAALARPAD
jgi:dihydrofolate synthase/folylpolyglutamate synthase